MKKIDIEQTNRKNFKAIMNALSRPGNIENIEPLFNSAMLAISSVLLYSQVSFFYDGDEDMQTIKTISNAKNVDCKNADYIFADKLDNKLLKEAKVGIAKEPEFSATLVFLCSNFNKHKVCLSGAGIDGQKELELPVDDEFIRIFTDKNSLFPLGNDVLFITQTQILAIARTTKIRSL